MVNKMKYKKLISFSIIIILLITTFLYSIQKGSLDASLGTIFKGIFIEYDEIVSSIYHLRFPRIMISMLSGLALSISGVLLQVSLKNKLADPGIIGISAGASLGSILIVTFFPMLYFYKHIFAFLGGVIVFIIIFTICRNSSPIKIILVGVAISMVCQGLYDLLSLFQGGSSVSVSTGVTMKTWDDVVILFVIVFIGLLLSMLLSKRCNLMLLDDSLIKNLGVNVQLNRIVISATAILLASSTTAIVGVVGFIGLLVPHISRMVIGSDHKLLIPFSGLVGAWLFLLADTIGRTVLLPIEIPASIILCIIGGPLFIMLIGKVNRYE